MARTNRQASKTNSETVACYALVQPGLEEIAAEEIQRDLGGEIRKSAPGMVVFRVKELNPRLLSLRTTEDVFLYAWGTDQLSYRATDLELIERWTARQVDWHHLLQQHHRLRPRPKGKPTYRLVAQMEGEHGYLRKHAGQALARGLSGVFPDSWRPAEENASVEVWLTIDQATAICGVRLSDRTMRHRAWKLEHRPASLRPTVAAAMVRLAGIKPGDVVLDPMCGAGTILAEVYAYCERFRGAVLEVRGGDLEFAAVRAATTNLRKLGAPPLCQWDARQLPLGDHSVQVIVSNPPFGKQLGSPQEIATLYPRMIREYDRILSRSGRAVLLVSDHGTLRQAIEPICWKREGEYRVRVLGQAARISVWRKADA